MTDVTLELLERHKGNRHAVLVCKGCGGSYAADPKLYRWTNGSPILCPCQSKPGHMLHLVHREIVEKELT